MGLLDMMFSWLVCTVIFFSWTVSNAEDKLQELFHVKPGGVRHEVTKEWDGVKCTFAYKAQGGTHEEWHFSLSREGEHHVCRAFRPDEKSYLFFQEFHLSVAQATLQNAAAFGERGSILKDSEYVIDKKAHTVTEKAGKFGSQLTKVEIQALKSKQEL